MSPDKQNRTAWRGTSNLSCCVTDTFRCIVWIQRVSPSCTFCPRETSAVTKLVISHHQRCQRNI